ncbi:DeoR family transcriptional regulator [Enterococcus florum]|uniref:DeoR family transcriptional regulator n=1 Tax=Enterococcus florum TaxID=2480627 RepID=A0A4P5PCK8_9ENTE|nr:sugar-binding domain-containing protein [Enterococcus florum]GCF93182.1 DeoR family transcriptional regulator [Enterococcus florum]
MANEISTLLKVAELYYLDRMNQNDIAKIIGVSRPSISRMLEEAREKHIVKISIEAPFERNNALMIELKRKFELVEVIVVKSLGDYEYDLDNVGKAAADYLSTTLTEEKLMGISWGVTVEKMVKHFPEMETKNVQIVQLTGSLGPNRTVMDGNELVFRLAQKVNGKHDFFNAPAFVGSKSLQKELLAQPQIDLNISLGRKMDIAFSGIGNIEATRNTLVSSGILDNEDLNDLIAEGAIGTMIGRAFNIDGKEIHYRNQFPISSSLDSLRSAPISIGAAASKNRARATFGAINGKLINVLICDEELGNALLAM